MSNRIISFRWKPLKTTQRVGAYAEYFVKMEITLQGFQVYSNPAGGL